MQGENNRQVFREVQRTPLWVWLIVLPIAAFHWYWWFQQLLLKVPFGEKPAPDWLVLLLWLVLGVALPAFLFILRLETEVRSDALYFRYFPLHLSYHRMLLSQLTRYEVKTYNPIGEYLGWGIIEGRKYSAYTMSGDRGVQLWLSDGRRVLIGSRKPEKLLAALVQEAARKGGPDA